MNIMWTFIQIVLYFFLTEGSKQTCITLGQPLIGESKFHPKYILDQKFVWLCNLILLVTLAQPLMGEFGFIFLPCESKDKPQVPPGLEVWQYY